MRNKWDPNLRMAMQAFPSLSPCAILVHIPLPCLISILLRGISGTISTILYRYPRPCMLPTTAFLFRAAQNQDALQEFIVINMNLPCPIFDLPSEKMRDSKDDDRPWYKACLCSSAQRSPLLSVPVQFLREAAQHAVLLSRWRSRGSFRFV